MKLLLAVIQDADSPGLIRELSRQGFEVTKLASTGGFLREGNTTLMLGVADERLSELKELIAHNCRSRTRLTTPSVPIEHGEELVTTPIEVPVGGAVLFVLDVAEFVKF